MKTDVVKEEKQGFTRDRGQVRLMQMKTDFTKL